MIRQIAAAALVLCSAGVLGQSPTPRPNFDTFDVATIRQVESNEKTGRYIKMLDPHRFIAKDYTLNLLIAAAYDLNPRTIAGGPAWGTSDHYDIVALTPGEVQPSRAEQMAMLRALLSDRFKLNFHREPKEFSIYVLGVAHNGSKLKQSTAAPDVPAALISTVYPQRILLPARNTTMGEFVSMLQRSILDRPVVDKTGLTSRYDFDLEWAPDESQFGGEISAASAQAPSAPLFTAIQEQLGLKLEATRGPVASLVVDTVERPSAN
jgi:uncharacterized protein (TIGR03435 family)